MIAQRQGKSYLCLEHAFRAALAPPVEKQDNRPRLVFIAPEVFGQVDLEAVRDSVELNLAIQKSGFLSGGYRRSRVVPGLGGASGAGEHAKNNTQAGSQDSRKSDHARRPS